MGDDRWHPACKAYHYLVRNSRTDLTQQNVQLAQLYLANGSLDTFTYETLAACELSYISLSGTNPRKGLFGLPVAMRDFIERSFNWEHIAPPSVGLTACNATCVVQGKWPERLRRPLPSVIMWMRE